MKTLLLLASLFPIGQAMAVESVESKTTAAVTVAYYCGWRADKEYNYPLKFQVVSATGVVLDSGTVTNYLRWDDCITAAKAANEATAR